MITKNDFMKDYRKMTADEQKSYIERVEKWNEETYPQLMAEVTSWMNVPVKEFKEGMILCTAVHRARPFALASRSFKHVDVVLKKMNAILVEVAEKSGLRKEKQIYAGDTRKWFAATEVKSAPDENGVVTVKKYEEPEVDGRRPQHVSEYIHLLPKKIQMEAANLKQMHMELAMYRGEAEELSKDAHATKEQIAEKARKAVDTEQRIRVLYATLDAAYKQATHQELNADEQALLAEEEQPQELFKRAGEYTKAEIDAMPMGKMKDDCTAARIDANKRYIRRDRAASKEQMELRAQELVAWGIEIGEKGKQKLTEAGIVIPGVNDDAEEVQVVSKEALEGKTVAGIDDNPMDGVSKHTGSASESKDSEPSKEETETEE